jgi:hypothetical protein
MYPYQEMCDVIEAEFAEIPGPRPAPEDHSTVVPYTPSSFSARVECLTWDGTGECLAALLDWLRAALQPDSVGLAITPAPGDATALQLSVTHRTVAGQAVRREVHMVPTGWTVSLFLSQIHVTRRAPA